MSRLIQEKGYKIEVISWENDRDNYRTEYLIEQDKKTAIAIASIIRDLFRSENDRKNPGIGNSFEDNKGKISDYFKKNPFLIEKKEYDDDKMVYFVSDLAGELMGYSEHYNYRVCDSVRLTYSPVDVYDVGVTEIEF